jgi:hypothetical protein
MPIRPHDSPTTSGYKARLTVQNPFRDQVSLNHYEYLHNRCRLTSILVALQQCEPTSLRYHSSPEIVSTDMDYRHTGEIAMSKARAQVGVTPAVNDHILTPETRQSYESFTPLLSTSIPNSNDVETSQQQAPTSREEEPPFIRIWPKVIVFVAIILPFL